MRTKLTPRLLKSAKDPQMPIQRIPQLKVIWAYPGLAALMYTGTRLTILMHLTRRDRSDECIMARKPCRIVFGYWQCTRASRPHRRGSSGVSISAFNQAGVSENPAPERAAGRGYRLDTGAHLESWRRRG